MSQIDQFENYLYCIEIHETMTLQTNDYPQIKWGIESIIIIVIKHLEIKQILALNNL